MIASVKQAELRDYAAVKVLWDEMKSGLHGDRIDCNIETMDAYFAFSQTHAGVKFLLLYVGEELKGFAVLEEIAWAVLGLQCFMRAVFIKPGTGRYSSKAFTREIESWARGRGHRNMIGFCNLDFPLEAYSRLHGIKPFYTVVGKEL